MENVTYLLGAGASAQAIPTVGDLQLRMESMRHAIEGRNRTPLYNKLIVPFINDFNELLNLAKNHATFDTFMRRLYVTENEDYDKYKLLFSAYLTLEHVWESRGSQDPRLNFKTADVRYDTFLANFIAPFTKRLPENFKVLTWNYDLQWIKAALLYFPDYDYSALRHYLMISANNQCYTNDNNFNIFHLNGLAELIMDEGGGKTFRDCYLPNLNLPFNDDTIYAVLDNYIKVSKATEKHKYTSLSFVWETDARGGQYTIEQSKKSTSKTETLIVVGYSFPYYNRKVDKELINNMSQLKKIYIQDCSIEASKRIEHKFKEVIGSKDAWIIQAVEADTREFFIPNNIDFHY